MLITQGLDDKVVPPSQLDAMVAALHGRGIPHAAIAFDGEGHGYRRAESRRRLYAAELSFLGQVFGFAPADAIEPLVIEHLAQTA
jgi:dipeptidyl aminopeptidase/acylaminoacyl peptidase